MVAGVDLRRAVRLLACVTGVSDNPYSNVTLRISLRIHHLQEHKTKSHQVRPRWKNILL
jgi:hypothetical protein